MILESSTQSAYLHDIGRSIEHQPENQGINHAALSARLATPFLVRMDIFGEDVDAITECILGHSFSAGQAIKSVESQILSDADKLDAMGAIGIYRMVHFQAAAHRGMRGLAEHLDEKLLRLKDILFTATARCLA